MGSSSMTKLLSILVVVMPMAVAVPRNQEVVIEKVHVDINNLLEYGPTLTVHCWSKDNDLGEQYIPPKDFWTFSFGLDILGRTRFDCTFKYNDEIHRFPIYVETRDVLACKHCKWTIALAGPCRLPDFGKGHCFGWEDSPKESAFYVPPPFK